jgi:hypothetical protein
MDRTKIPTTGLVEHFKGDLTMKSSFTRRLAWLAAVSTLSLSGLAAAQSTGGPSGDETKKPGASMPAEQAAIDACKDKKDGDRVRFTDAKGKKRHYACSTVDGVMAARSGVATAAHPVKKK